MSRRPEPPKIRWKHGNAHVRFRRAGKRYEISLETQDEIEARERLAQFIEIGPAVHLRPKRSPMSIGGVYFIGSDCGRIKIGWSRDPVKRLRDLAQKGPRALAILAVEREASKATEMALHDLLEAHRVHGKTEWYEPAASLLAIIEDVRHGLGLPSEVYRRALGPRKLRGKLALLREKWGNSGASSDNSGAVPNSPSTKPL